MRSEKNRIERLGRAALAVAILSYLPTSSLWAQSAPSPDVRSAYNISAGSLEAALDQFSQQGGIQTLSKVEQLAGKQVGALSGQMTWREALGRLLKGSGLEYQQINATTVVIRPASGGSSPSRSRPAVTPPVKPIPGIAPKVTDIQGVTVTGSRIRGAQPSSPLVLITQDDMRLSGQSDLGEVIRALPQNFSGGQNPGVQPGAGGNANANLTGGSSLNLRGLGADATLTLLNGARLPYDGFSQATDVAVIPVAAIDRMEVLLDGASAVYGSDAVGGVANIVLKRDFDGADVSVQNGQSTDGGNRQTRVSAVVGSTWSSGGFLLAGETTNGSAVWADQRDYFGYVSRPDLLTIYPKSSQHGFLLSGHQALGTAAELTLDAFHTRRSASSSELYGSLVAIPESNADIYGISPMIRVTLPGEWDMRIHGFVGADRAESGGDIFLINGGALAARSWYEYKNVVKSSDVDFEGAVFALPGGEARASLGGGVRKTTYEQTNLLTGANQVSGSGKDYFAYGELNLPLIGEQQGLRFANSLSLNAAFRYEHYNDFGSITTPKVGFLWNIVPSLDFRASWGRSFKAPTAFQRLQPISVLLQPAASLGIPDVPSTAAAIITSGGNPDLGAERAKTFTAGLVFHPQALPGASVELSWFNIDYTHRVVAPFLIPYAQFGQAMSNPAYASFIVQNPDAGEQERIIRDSASFTNYSGAPYDPANVVALFKTQYFNASSQLVRGIDLDARYSAPAWGGLWSFNAAGSYIAKSKQALVDGTPKIDAVGVVAFPPRFKGRLSANWSRSNFTAGAVVNYLGGVKNTAITPVARGDSMTTIDLVLDYAADSTSMGGLGFNLAIMNAFNQRPPLLRPTLPFYVNYDSTNYSSLGRVVNLTVTKHF